MSTDTTRPDLHREMTDYGHRLNDASAQGCITRGALRSADILLRQARECRMMRDEQEYILGVDDGGELPSHEAVVARLQAIYDAEPDLANGYRLARAIGDEMRAKPHGRKIWKKRTMR